MALTPQATKIQAQAQAAAKAKGLGHEATNKAVNAALESFYRSHPAQRPAPSGGGGASDPQAGINAAISDMQISEALLRSDPSLKAILQNAITNNIPQAAFEAQIKATAWWTTHSDSWRAAQLQKADDPTTYQQDITTLSSDMKARGLQMGASMSPDQLTQMATLAKDGNWSDSQKNDYMGQFLTVTTGGSYLGEAGIHQMNLEQLAGANGVTFGQDWYGSAVKNIMTGGADQSLYDSQIREMAAGIYTPWADQIKSGQNVKDIAAPYTNSMSNLLETPTSITDPTFMQNIFKADDKNGGALATQPLWQFEKGVRQDPRWMQTKNADNTIASVGSQLLSSWGLSK